jgi:hypothetical protein
MKGIEPSSSAWKASGFRSKISVHSDKAALFTAAGLTLTYTDKRPPLNVERHGKIMAMSTDRRITQNLTSAIHNGRRSSKRAYFTPSELQRLEKVAKMQALYNRMYVEKGPPRWEKDKTEPRQNIQYRSKLEGAIRALSISTRRSAILPRSSNGPCGRPRKLPIV